jgi:BirA family biotin operon repressor/biotin-[acetyl-CoA-carboxylase] ligase
MEELKIFHLNEVDSTNSYLLKLMKLGMAEEGTTVTADFQHEGRGQRNSKWESQKGSNLLFSMIHYPPKLAADKAFYSSMAVALAVFRVSETYFPGRSTIKWPNDILIDGLKTAGILIESGVQDGKVNYFIAGIGINLNQKNLVDVVQTATSFAWAGGRSFSIYEVEERLNYALRMEFERLDVGDYEYIKSNFEAVLYGNGMSRLFQISGETILGTIEGVDAFGQLKIRIGSELKTFGLKEVAFVF